MLLLTMDAYTETKMIQEQVRGVVGGCGFSVRFHPYSVLCFYMKCDSSSLTQFCK